MAEAKEKHGNRNELVPEISSESVKLVAESIGIASAAEDSCKYLADDVTYKLKNIIQEALKVALNSNRVKLTKNDIDATLKMQNYEPIYGFTSTDYIPFRNASGGGRNIHFIDDKEVDLDDLISKPMPKVPLQPSLKAHWLAIEGVQPAIPENPAPVSRDLQKLEGINPVAKASVEKLGKPGRSAQATKKTKDVMVKPLAEHDLSVEQQLYYKEITEACVGSDETRRTEALTSLSQDPGLHKMLPRLSTFISEGVKVNCVNNNLAILIYLMRMIKSLLENSSLYLEKYLHELIPSVMTCVVSKQLCMKPETDNHWALRDFSAKILGLICRKFSTSTNDLQTRIVKTLSDALHNPRMPLTTHYGCMSGLNEIGVGAVQNFLVPVIKVEGERLKALLEGVTTSTADRVAAQQVKQALMKIAGPVLKAMRKPPDAIDAYCTEFGYFGPFLHDSVTRIRNQSTATTSLLARPGTVSALRGPSRHCMVRGGMRPAYHVGQHVQHQHGRNLQSMFHQMHGPTHLPLTTPRYYYNSRHLKHWPSASYGRGAGTVTLLPSQHSSINRSFSLPGGTRTVSAHSNVIRVATPGTSLVRTPTTPSTPGSASGSQKYIIMSTTSASTLQTATPSTPTIVKVMTSQQLNQQLPGQTNSSQSHSGEQSFSTGTTTPKLEPS